MRTRLAALVLAFAASTLAGAPARPAADWSRFAGVRSWHATWSVDLVLDTVETDDLSTVVYKVDAGISGSCDLPLENRPMPGGDYFDWHIPDGAQPTYVDGRYHTWWKRTETDGSYAGGSSDHTAFQEFGDDAPLLHLHLDSGTYDFSLPNATFETDAVMFSSGGSTSFATLGVITPWDLLHPGADPSQDVPLPAEGDVLEGTYSFDAFVGGFPRAIPCTIHYRFTPTEAERTIAVTKLQQKPAAKSAGGTDFVFSHRRLVLYAEAAVTPKEKVTSVQWDLPEIAGSARKIARKVGRKRGIAKLTVTWTGLPPSNADFGAKTIRARLEDGGTPRQDERAFRVFFERDGTDHPGGTRDANWYHYWKQGAVPDLAQFTYSRRTRGAEYDPGTGALRIGSDATAAFGPLTLSLSTAFDGGHTATVERDRMDGIEAVAAAVCHELMHRTLIERAQQAGDTDGDGVHIDEEADVAACPPWTWYDAANTYGVTIDDFYGGNAQAWVDAARGKARRARAALVASQAAQLAASGDNELKAIASEKTRLADPEEDWASPGSQAGK